MAGKLIFGSVVKWEKVPALNIKASLIDQDTDRYIYIRSRIITCDEVNGNGDYLPKAEVLKIRADGKKTWETFIGTIIDYNHDTSIELGKTIDANFVDEKDGQKAYVELIGKIDRKPPVRFTRGQQQFYAKLISRIEADDLNKMSMEAFAENARCNYCKTVFAFTQPCDHVANYMNAKIKAADGSDFHVCREDMDVTFVGSGIVENPADKNAEFKNIMANEDVISKIKIEGKIDYIYLEQWLNVLKEKNYDKPKVIEMLKGIGIDYEIDTMTKNMVDSMFEVEVVAFEINLEIGETYKRDDLLKMGFKLTDKDDYFYETKSGVDYYFQKQGDVFKYDGSGTAIGAKKMTAAQALANISGLELMKIIDALDNGDDRVTAIVTELSASIKEPIYESELKIDKRLTSMEINKIKAKLIDNEKLIDKSINAQLIKLNGKDTWLIMKNTLPAMKRTLDEIWGEDLKAEGTIDGMSVEDYAKSDLFKRRMLMTYQTEGQEYLENIWSKLPEETEKTVESVLKIESNDYKKMIEEMKTEIHASKDEFKACLNANINNTEIKATDGITHDEAIEAFCFKKVMGIQASYVPKLNDIFKANIKLESVVGGETNFKAWLKYKETGKFPTTDGERIQIKLFAKSINELSEVDKDILVKASNLIKFGFTLDDVKKYHILASETDIKKLQKYDMTIDSMRELFNSRFGFKEVK